MQIFKQENDIEYMFALGRLLCDQSERMEEWLLQWFRWEGKGLSSLRGCGHDQGIKFSSLLVQYCPIFVWGFL